MRLRYVNPGYEYMITQIMEFQKEEISEIFFVPYKKFKEMVNNKQPDLLMHTEEFEILFNMFDNEFGR